MSDQAKDQEKVAAQNRQVVVFRLDNEEYAVAIEEVREVVDTRKITPVPEAASFIVGVMNLRGKIVPVLDLEKRFSLKRDNQIPLEHIVIFDDQKGGLFGICVDKVTEVLKISEDLIKSPPKLITSKIASEFLQGVIVLSSQKETTSNERIVLLLDVPKILNQSELDKLKTTGDDKNVAANEQQQKAPLTL